ncbi:kinase-associated lipoprotein B [Priestia koreensis]|uniref:kinase-associated lipoprotein B n=1 Tax=Priestia koreensis TaxID=284581 RepID=UPI001F59760C|nr:kinase-associated lipoprotein B [Priestia koreensis]MCM3004949.1 kinase-associated lipoprotein B [Priestia koreensis]UNL87247.1 kinase-associated lipoprotein B [Priestia koreensis]
MMTTLQIGDHVTAIYKTGKYIGEITNTRPGTVLVKVLAVMKHPRQGDLHNPNEVDVPLFHERKALAFREQTNIPEKMVKPFDGDIPEYKESLITSFQSLQEQLRAEETPFATRSLETLAAIQPEYERMYKIVLQS